MNIMIAGGTGFVGQYCVKHFLESQHQITVVGRDAVKIGKVFGDLVQALEWQALKQQGTQVLDNIDLVINLAGASIGEQRWHEARRQEIIHSRTETTEHLAQLCAQKGAESPPLFNASAVGVYGLQRSTSKTLPEAFTEDSRFNWGRPTDFLSRVGRAWEDATKKAKDAGVRVVNLRFGVVLGPDGGALQKMVQPFKFFIGGPIGRGRQPFPWVSIVDLARAIDFIYQHKNLTGPINIVAPECVNQKQLAITIGQVLLKPSIVRTPAFLLKFIYGQMAKELLLQGQHVKPQRLLDAGFEFTHPDIKSALTYALLEKKSAHV